MANPNWVRGVSGNPGGRPKSENSLSALLRKVPKKKKKQLADMLWALALGGNLNAAQMIINRIDGLPVPQGQVKNVVRVIVVDDNTADDDASS